MNKSMYIIISVLLIGLISIGIAMWSDTLKTNTYVSTGEVSIEFVNGSVIYLDACGLQPGYGYYCGNDWNATRYPDSYSSQIDKDVGCTAVNLTDTDGDGDSDTMTITLNNVYPWYYTHIAFKIHNNGKIPIKIWKVILNNGTHDFVYYELNEQELQQGEEIDLNGDGLPDITVWWGDNFGTQLHPCQSADISLDITVLQTAPQNTTLTFTIKILVVQWNEYHVP